MIRIYLACVFICLVSLFHARKDTFGFDTFFLLELDFKTLTIYMLVLFNQTKEHQR